MDARIKYKKKQLARVKDRIADKIWEKELSNLGAFQRFFRFQLRVIYLVGQGIKQDLLRVHSLALAFKTLLSIVPLLAVIFSALKVLGMHNRFRPALDEALAPLGPKGEEIANRLIEFVDHVSVGALGTAGLVTLFITVLSLMGSIEQAFNQIWRVKIHRKIARKFSDYLGVVLLGPILIIAAVGITASLQSNTLVQKVISWEPFGSLILAVLRLVPYLTIWGAFTLLYFLIPNTRVRLRSALVGGFVAAVLWGSIGWGFAVFVASSTRYYAIYSSFAILLLFLLWVYIGWVIVLLGAEVAFAHQDIRDDLDRSGASKLRAAAREGLAVHIMGLFGSELPWSAEQLTNEIQAPPRLIEELLDRLVQSELLVRVADGEAFLPARDLDKISVKEILDGVGRSDERQDGSIDEQGEKRERS